MALVEQPTMSKWSLSLLKAQHRPCPDSRAHSMLYSPGQAPSKINPAINLAGNRKHKPM